MCFDDFTHVLHRHWQSHDEEGRQICDIISAPSDKWTPYIHPPYCDKVNSTNVEWQCATDVTMTFVVTSLTF